MHQDVLRRDPLRRSFFGPSPERRRGPLRPLLKGLASGSLAVLVAGAIEHGVRAHLRHGHQQIATDGLGMLWVPGVLALLAALFLTQALLQSLTQGLGLLASLRPALVRRWVPPQPSRHSAPPPTQPLLQQDSDPYRQACERLGVPPGSSWHVIRSAWRRQLPQWHPDRGGDPELWHTRLAAYRLLDASTPRASVAVRR